MEQECIKNLLLQFSKLLERNHLFLSLFLSAVQKVNNLRIVTRELKQLRQRQLRERQKFAYLTMKNKRFARFARAFFILAHFMAFLVLSMKGNDLFCRCLNDVTLRHKFSIFALLSLKHRFLFNAMKLRKRVASIMVLNN